MGLKVTSDNFGMLLLESTKELQQGGKMDKRTRAYIMTSLRQASYKWPSRNLALKEARISRGVYECAGCKSHFGRKEIQVDHIIPVMPLNGSDDFNVILERLFCPSEGLQILCKPCHKDKTDLENKARKEYRRIKKDILDD